MRGLTKIRPQDRAEAEEHRYCLLLDYARFTSTMSPMPSTSR
jgi:hypothetical protein